MDPLSVSASIFALLQLSGKIITYVNASSGARDERKRLRDGIRGFQFILQQLQDESDDSEAGKAWSATLEALSQPDGPLHRLQIVLNLLKTKLQPKDGPDKLLKWPFQEKEVMKMVDTIEREKSLLSLALNNNSGRVVHEINIRSRENTAQLAELMRNLDLNVQDSGVKFQELEKNVFDIQAWQMELQSGIDRLHEHKDDQESLEERRAILDWLTPIDHVSHHYDASNKRQKGTGKWFLDSKAYQDWLSAEGETLFCPGLPGAGKTALASMVVDDLRERYLSDSTVGIVFIYFDFNRHKEQTNVDLPASLLKQLVEGQTIVPDSVKAFHKSHHNLQQRPPWDDLWKTLQKVAKSYRLIFIVVDALDECHEAEGQRTKFLAKLFDLLKTCRINLLATSRLVPEIMERFSDVQNLDIRASNEDVREYLDEQMIQLPKYVQNDPILQEDIKSRIVESIDGMFLLARLHFDSLIGKRSAKAVQTALRKLATGYDPAYREAMERIEAQVGDKPQMAKQVLAWLTCAKQPIDTLALQEALTVEAGELELDLENRPDIDYMVSCCAGLVKIDNGSDIIRLVHYTTQEFFERTQREWFPDAELVITRVCITYLSFDAFNIHMGPKTTIEGGFLETHKFCDYAARNWGHHARLAPSAHTQVMDFLNRQQIVQASYRMAHRSELWQVDFIGGIHLAAQFGLEAVVTEILLKNPDPDLIAIWNDPRTGPHVYKSETATPLLIAAQHGHETVARILIEHKAAIDYRSEYGNTALELARRAGHEAVGQLLLEHGATFSRHSALHEAAERGDVARIRLLANDLAINETYCDWETSIFLAAHFGQAAAVESLIQAGVNVNVRNCLLQTALFPAAECGSEPVVKILLDARVNIKAQDCNGESALLFAARFGNEAVLKLLLNAGAHMNHLAAKDERVLKTLLRNGADVNCEDAYGESILIKVARQPEAYAAGAIQRLIDAGAELTFQDSFGWTPLHRACQGSDAEMVRTFIDNGANPNCQNKEGQSPLFTACSMGSAEIVKTLLDNGTDVNHEDESGSSPLLEACFRECKWEVADVMTFQRTMEELVKVLLDNGADVNHSDQLGRTPLSVSARQGWEGLIKLLLDAGAHVHHRDRHGQTPLFSASGNLDEENVKILLDNGADPNARDQQGNTTLSVAMRKATHRENQGNDRVDAIIGILKAAGAV